MAYYFATARVYKTLKSLNRRFTRSRGPQTPPWLFRASAPAARASLLEPRLDASALDRVLRGEASVPAAEINKVW